MFQISISVWNTQCCTFSIKKYWNVPNVCAHMQTHTCKAFDLLLYSSPACVHLHISPWTHTEEFIYQWFTVPWSKWELQQTLIKLTSNMKKFKITLFKSLHCQEPSSSEIKEIIHKEAHYCTPLCITSAPRQSPVPTLTAAPSHILHMLQLNGSHQYLTERDSINKR